MRNYFRHSGRVSDRGRRVRLHLEALEDRTLLSAQLFTVTSTSDDLSAATTKGTLRWAVTQADMPGNAGSTIEFSNSLSGKTITLTQDQLDITNNMTINGLGANRLAVSGGGTSRVFYVSPNTKATIAQLTIKDGLASLEPPTVVLRCHGGGILNDTGADLTLTDDIFSHNTAQGFEDAGNGPNDEFRHLGGGAGGAVANVGTLHVTDCTFIDNQALGFNGQQGANLFPNLQNGRFPGIALGGGIWNWLTGTATVTDSRFIDNLAHGGNNCTGSFAGLANGGAIYNDNDLTVTGSLFYGNQAVGGSNITNSDALSGPATGGAISSGTNERLIGATESAVLNVSQCIFSHNQAHGGDGNLASAVPQGVASAGGVFGGGICVFQGVATISQSVLDHNQAIGGDSAAGQIGGTVAGGGIVFVNFLSRPTDTGGVTGVTGSVEDCALVGNEAIGGTGGAGARGGNAQGSGIAGGSFGLSTLPGSVTLTNTLVAGNLVQGGDGGSGGNGGDGLGGGVFNGLGETLTASHTALLFNEAEGGTGANGGNGLGGGLYNAGPATLDDSIIAFNAALGGAAGLGGKAGTGEGGGGYDAAGGTISLVGMTAIFGNKPDDRFGF
jgi:hypothetical protein